MPRRYASMTSSYRDSEKINVMLVLMPAARFASIAGTPSFVAGILMSTFLRPTSWNSLAACATVSSVSRARSGDTSRDTNPSAPPVAS